MIKRPVEAMKRRIRRYHDAICFQANGFLIRTLQVYTVA